MCLHAIKNGCVERKIAQEDIPCVKILNEIDGALYSPFKAMLYVLGKKYEATIGEPSPLYFIGDEQLNIVIGEGLHSFASDIRDDISMFNETLLIDNGSFYAAVIPKGAEYYEGSFNLDKSYVSNQLIVKEKI